MHLLADLVLCHTSIPYVHCDACKSVYGVQLQCDRSVTLESRCFNQCSIQGSRAAVSVMRKHTLPYFACALAAACSIKFGVVGRLAV